MAKAPEPGRVKTRLSPPLSAAAAARLASAFLIDTWASASAAGDAVLVLDGDPARLPPALRQVPRWRQASGDLGARMEAAARRALDDGVVPILVGTDAPGLPAALLDGARAALRQSASVVGPALDGGYYLLGLRRCPARLLSDLPWSAPDTLAATRTRLASRGLTVAALPRWFDVDEADDLALLRRAIAAGWVRAPATAEVLADAEAAA